MASLSRRFVAEAKRRASAACKSLPSYQWLHCLSLGSFTDARRAEQAEQAGEREGEREGEGLKKVKNANHGGFDF